MAILDNALLPDTNMVTPKTQEKDYSKLPGKFDYPQTTSTGFTPEQQAQYNKTLAMFSQPVTPINTSSPLSVSDMSNTGTINTKVGNQSSTSRNNLSATVNSAVEGATIESKQNQTTPSATDQATSEYLNLIKQQGGRAQETLDLQAQQDITGKTKAVNSINSRMVTLSRGYDKQIKELEKNTSGMSTPELSAELGRLTKTRDEHLADLAIQKSVALGDLETANKIVETTIAAKYEPIEQQLSSYERLINIYQNDMTESEKFQAQTNLQKARDEADYLKGLQTAAINDANSAGQSSVASAITLLDPSDPQFKTKLAQYTRQIQAKSTGGGVLSSLPSSVQTKLLSSADEFNSRKEIQKFVATVDAANVLNIVDPNSKNPADHQAIVYGFAKALDPESVVRGEEYEAVKKYAQSLFNQYKGEISNAIAGTGFLSANAIADMQTTIKNLYKARLPIYENAFAEKSRVLNNIAGVDVAESILEKKTGGYSKNSGDIKSQVASAGYDYDAMRADGYSDAEIKQAVGL